MPIPLSSSIVCSRCLVERASLSHAQTSSTSNLCRRASSIMRSSFGRRVTRLQYTEEKHRMATRNHLSSNDLRVVNFRLPSVYCRREDAKC